MVADLAFVLIGVPFSKASLIGKGTIFGPFHTERDSNLSVGIIIPVYMSVWSFQWSGEYLFIDRLYCSRLQYYNFFLSLYYFSSV